MIQAVNAIWSVGMGTAWGMMAAALVLILMAAGETRYESIA
jgi:hypothetical protein